MKTVNYMNSIKNEKSSIFEKDLGWKQLLLLIEELKSTSVFVITDTNTEAFCLPIFRKKIPSTIPIKVLTFNAGETNKVIETCIEIWTQLINEGADKRSLIINLGGGVVSDLGGFVASTFNRGLPFINIPTTLLAMVDAAVGGKNGIDFNGIKNKIGVINEPNMVLVDSIFLKTLSANEILSGFAEMLKHGLITSEAYYTSLKNMGEKTEVETDRLIWESIKIKNKVVLADPLEQNVRKTLNYGHTLGHAIESYCLDNDYKQTLLHGEAIAIGMILATYFSHKILYFEEEKLNAITSEILDIYEKIDFTEEDIKEIIKLTTFDKKNTGGVVNFVLLRDFGDCKLDCKVEESMIFDGFNFYKNF